MRTPDARRIPLGLLVAIGMILAIESLMAHARFDFTTNEFRSWSGTRSAAEGRARGADILCLGTSMVKQGIFPLVMERRTGLRVENLAVVGGHVPGFYYLFKRALDSGARPSAIVVDIHPNFRMGDYKDYTVFWPNVLGANDCLDMAWTVGDANFLARTMLSKALPSVLGRAQTRSRIMAAFRGEPADDHKISRALERNISRNLGAVVNPKNTRFQGEVSPVFESLLVGDMEYCHPIQELYMRKIFELARERGITVYWLVMPLTPALQARREAKGLDAKYTRFIESFQGYPNLVIVDGRRSGYIPTSFVDAAHLDLQGGSVLSEDLADLIAQHPAAIDPSRWISLPTYRDRPPSFPILEDMVQSVLALGDDSATRR